MLDITKFFLINACFEHRLFRRVSPGGELDAIQRALMSGAPKGGKRVKVGETLRDIIA